MIPNQIMAMRNKQTGEVSGVLLDCDPLPTDPIQHWSGAKTCLGQRSGTSIREQRDVLDT
jgi:hypothetical protein